MGNATRPEASDVSTNKNRHDIDSHDTNTPLTRRQFLAASGAGLTIAGSATAPAAATTARKTAPTPTAPFDSLRDYVSAMEASGNVMRFDRIDQDAYEGTALMYRLVDRYGWYRTPIVIFEEVKINGQWIKGPVVANELRHIEAETLLFGLDAVPFDDSATSHRAREHLDQMLADNNGEYPAIPPVEISREQAVCKEVVLSGDDIDIRKFPFFKNNPGDSGRFINTGSVFTSDPEMGVNIGTYRCELKGPRHIAVGSGEGQTGYTMLMRARERGEKTAPLTIIVGQEPLVWLVSGARIPARRGKKPVDELATAGGLRGKAIEVVKCDTNEFLIPAETELVIEGEVSLESFELNGPYGEGSGYMGAPYESAFTMTVNRITHRRDPWIVNDFTGVTRALIEQPSAALTVAGLQRFIPGITDYRYSDSVTWISMTKSEPGQALETGKQLAKLIPVFKIVIMVDDDVDLWNSSDRFMAFATRWQAWPASYIYEDLPTMPLEPSSPQREHTSKIVIDATRQWPEEGGPQKYPEYSRDILERHSPEIFALVDSKWGARINHSAKD
jgi:4-hydroxy-3-polyprenylbenzoate decarboxylase